MRIRVVVASVALAFMLLASAFLGPTLFVDNAPEVVPVEVVAQVEQFEADSASAHSGSYLWCGIGGSLWRTYYRPSLYLVNGGHTHSESTFYVGRCYE